MGPMMRSKPFFATALALLLAIGLTACGSGDQGGSTESIATPTTSTEKPKSGEASIEEFGSEAAGSGREAILPALLAPTAAQVARQQADGQVTKVRDEGDRAFVVFKAPGAKLYQQTMVREGGEWKVATVAASVLVPDLSEVTS